MYGTRVAQDLDLDRRVPEVVNAFHARRTLDQRPKLGIVRQFLTHPVDHREYVVEVKIPIFRRGFCGQPTLAPEADPCAYVSVNRLS